MKVAFYGKGGIGKSTIAANTAAAFGKLGKKVLFIGCDPKGDSSRTIIGHKIKPIISVLIEKDGDIQKEDFMHTIDGKIYCIETGGPKAGMGCAGRGIITMMEELEKHHILEENWDVIIYDVLGDVVCGGFAVPMRDQYVEKVYIVTSSEYMSLYAANNIMHSIINFSDDQEPFFGGLIYNQRNNQPDNVLIENFTIETKSSIRGIIPFDEKYMLSELEGKTVVDKYPDSEIAEIFYNFAKEIKDHTLNVPEALEDEKLDIFFKRHLKKIVAKGKNMLVKTEQNILCTGLLQDMLKNTGISVIIVGPLSCLRTQYFRGKESGLLRQMYFYEINELTFVTNNHLNEILDLSERIVSHGKETTGLIIFTSCSDIISATNYKKVIRRINDKFNCPVVVLPRGPLAKRINSTKERLEEALKEIETYNILKEEATNVL